MGYSYTYEGLLCCDVCGHAGGVRKHRCPFGYCQPIALCPECKAKHPEYLSKELHRKNGCETNHLEFERQQKEKVDLLEQGKYVRCSALWHPPEDKVKVIFHGKASDKAYFMTQATYHSIPYGVNATIEDYQAKGTITECRNLDIYDPETGPAPELNTSVVATKEVVFSQETVPDDSTYIPSPGEAIINEHIPDDQDEEGEPLEPEPVKDVVLAKPTFNGMEICGRRGRKASGNQARLALEVDEL